jgi:gliding motility-associated-like protein
MANIQTTVLWYSNFDSLSCQIEGFVMGEISGNYNDCDDALTQSWTFTDNCGRMITHSRNIGISDSVPPVLTPPMVEIPCAVPDVPPYTSLNEFLAAGGTATDNCWLSEGSFSLMSESFTGSYPDAYSILRVYTIADVCGNLDTCWQTIAVPALLAAGIMPESPVLCPTDTLQLNGIPSGGTGMFTHAWSGEGAIYLDSTDIQDPSFSGAPVGTHTLTYTVTDENGCIASNDIVIIVDNETVPVFEPLGPLCQNTPPPVLPGISHNGITGTWEPPVISTAVPGFTGYYFTPDDGQCAVEAMMIIEIVVEITPVFDPVGPLCQYANAPGLPSVSLNGISGTWEPPVISTGIPGVTSYTFTPSQGECAVPVILEITIIEEITPLFDPIGPLCQNALAPALPVISLNGISGTWDPPVINTSNLGIFTFTFMPYEGQCAVQANVEIEIVDEVIPMFESIGPICQNTAPPALPDTSLNGVSGTWVPPVINTSVAGTAIHAFIPEDGQCALTVTMEVEIVDEILPVFDPIGPICQNTSPPLLPGISNNGITGVWEPPVINTVIPGISTYTFIPDTGQCAVLTTLEIMIEYELVPIFTQIGPLCLNTDPPSLPAVSNNFITGTWEPAVINTTILGISTYLFTPAEDECAVPVTMEIEIVDDVLPLFDPIGPLCQNTTPPALPSTSNNGITGTWEPPVINTSTVGTSTYTFTPYNGQCAVETTMEIEVIDEAIPTFAPLGALCQNAVPPVLPDTSQNGIPGTWEPPVINTSIVGITIYTFMPGPGWCATPVILEIEVVDEILPQFDPIPPLCQNTQPPDLQALSNNGISGTWAPPLINTLVAGTAVHSFTPSEGQCANPAVLEIVILPEIMPEFDPMPPICLNSTPPDLPFTSVNGLTGTWEPAVISTTSSGIYSYTFTPAGADCAVPVTLEIEVHALPEVNAGDDQTILSGTGTNLAGATVTGSAPFYISWSPAELLVNPYELNPATLGLSATTTFTLTVIDSNGCAGSDEVTIHIQNTPPTVLQAIAGPGGHCVGNSLTIPLEVDNFISVAVFQLKLKYNSVYLACEGYTNIHPQLADHLTASINLAAGEILFHWHSDAPLTFTQLEVVAELVFTTKQAGQGNLDWYTGDAESYFTNGAGSNIPAVFQSGVVNIYNPPEIDLVDSVFLCEGETFAITGYASTTQPPVNYLWTYPDGQIYATDPFIMNVTMADAGVYTLLATDNLGCTDLKSVVLVVFPNPEVTINGSDTIVMHIGDPLDAGRGFDYYLWNTGSNDQVIVAEQEGWHWVTVATEHGCLGWDSIFVVAAPGGEIPDVMLYVPNAFTPDGDGLNDTFKAVPKNDNITDFTMLIYNRWGALLWEGHDINVGWDGVYDGVLSPGDAYVYKIIWMASGVPGYDTPQVLAGMCILVQ